jgi:hypothetical protein
MESKITREGRHTQSLVLANGIVPREEYLYLLLMSLIKSLIDILERDVRALRQWGIWAQRQESVARGTYYNIRVRGWPVDIAHGTPEEGGEGGGVDIGLGGLKAQLVQRQRVAGEGLRALLVVELNVGEERLFKGHALGRLEWKCLHVLLLLRVYC